MKRKVIKQGHNTLTITLPIKWCLENNVKPGDDLEMDETSHVLKLFTPQNNSKESKFFLDTTRLGHFKGNYIACLYHAGFDEIDVKFNDPEIYKQIQKMMKASCQGYEIIDQRKDSCVIKSVSKVNGEDFDKMLRRIFLLFISLLEDTIDIFKTGEFQRLDNVRYMEELNNRHTGYCKRILTKEGYIADQKKTMMYYVLMYDLEIIVDDYKHIVDYLKNNKIAKISKPIVTYLEKVLHQFKTFYELFYKFDSEKAKVVFKDGRTLFDEGILLLEKINTKEKIVLHFILNTVMKIYEMTEPYLEMNLYESRS
jgi:phosphate uptake regulator